MSRTASALALGLLFLLIQAATLQAEDIPAPLRPWKAWVLHGNPEQTCPPRFNDGSIRRCWWPTWLNMDVNDQGGLFEQQVTVYAPTWVTLPGDATHWPESVDADQKRLPVVGRKGRPVVWLASGDYRLKGAFLWSALPEGLQVPESVGLLTLTVDGRKILEPDLNIGGRLRLHGKTRGVDRQDTLSISMFRLIEDDIPMRVTSRMLIEVSGRPREIRLASPLPAGGTLMKIDSPLPARLNQDGDLLVQARPGQWDIRTEVRLEGPVTTLSTGSGRYGEEIWSFKAYNHLRMVSVAGAPSIEPSRTRMPDEWKGFPAFQLDPAATLSFDLIRRGDPDPAPDQLHLERTWWLDFDGAGFTVHDRIGGVLNRGWHLAMGDPMQLGRVAVNGQAQLITLQGNRPGVQLRRGQLTLDADSRLERTSSTLPAVGWDHDFKQVSSLLHLPPGWSLFAAAGVDVPSGAWLQRWTLLDIFLVLIIAVSSSKVHGRIIGLLALITLALIYHEPHAPRQVWLHLLAVTALLEHLPPGRLERVVRLWGLAAGATLVVIALPFMVQQIRTAVYPQLAPIGDRITQRPALPMADAILETQKTTAPASTKALKGRLSTTPYTQPGGERPTAPKDWIASDPNALIQTGPGLPTWQWQSVRLHWNGPVDRTQKLRLWLISPILNLILGLLRVGLLLLLTAAFLDLRNWRRYLPVPLRRTPAALMAALVMLSPIPLLRAETAPAVFPPQTILDELRERLLEPPVCLPHCADMSRLELTATPDELRLIMLMHAQVDTAVPLPVTQETWRPNRLMLDNEPVERLARDERGNLWMVLPRGVHQVKMTGPALGVDEIRIAFPITPRVGTYAGVGWQVRGLTPEGGMDGPLSLTRLETNGEPQAEHTQAEIPAFFDLTRNLRLGIVWEVVTHIRRVTPPGDPVVLSVPLLENESVTTAGVQVKDGQAQIQLGPDEIEAIFSATLPIVPTIQLTAPSNVPWTETWVLDASTMWHVVTTGLTVVHHQNAGHRWQPQWRPWPGERVKIEVTRPTAIAGRSVTLDHARLVMTPGARVSRVGLTLGVRSSQGGQHQIELPEQANLQSVTINGNSLPIRQDGRLVTVPLEPGAQTVDLEWLHLSPSMNLISPPPVRVGNAAVNAAVTVHMPDHRWILFAGGPRLGPAVLFWSYVILVIGAAMALGKTNLTPLGSRQWILLGMGLTQVPAAVAVLVVAWLLGMGYRCRNSAPRAPLAFNLVQVVLAAATLAALAGLYLAIERGLLGIPDMQIAGNHSTRFQLNWAQDRIQGIMPTPWVVSLPQWTYRLLMLAWSLWLAFSLVSWLRWAWGCFSDQGLWKPIRWRFRTPSSAPPTNLEQQPSDDSQSSA